MLIARKVIGAPENIQDSLESLFCLCISDYRYDANYYYDSVKTHFLSPPLFFIIFTAAINITTSLMIGSRHNAPTPANNNSIVTAIAMIVSKIKIIKVNILSPPYNIFVSKRQTLLIIEDVRGTKKREGITSLSYRLLYS